MTSTLADLKRHRKVVEQESGMLNEKKGLPMSIQLVWRCRLVLIVSVLVLSLAACGGGGGGSNSAPVAPVAPSALSYAGPQTYSVGTAITALNPAVTGTVTSYSVSPALPTGLALDTSSGQITGTPTATASTAIYTVTAANSGGATTFALSITVKLSAPAVTVGYGVKQVILNWPAVSGATYYQVSKSPDGSAAGYTQLGDNLTSTTYADTVAVHLTDWVNVSYVVAACDTRGCTHSPAINGFDAKQAIGYFKASNTFYQHEFGGSVALSADGKTLAVGSARETSRATGIDGDQTVNWFESGAVYVFTRDGERWAQQAYIKASNTGSGDSFGSSVTLSASGHTLAVGAPGERSSAAGIDGDQTSNAMFRSGAAYVFARSGELWSQQAYVKASNPDSGDGFGSAVTLSADGNSLAVGAPGEGSTATGLNGDQTSNAMPGSGAAYLFSRSGSTWSQESYLKASNTGAGDSFGVAIRFSSDGNTLVVGAPHEDSAARGVEGDQLDDSMPDSGAVYVFVRAASTWVQEVYLKASNADASDHFGDSLAISADGAILAVGATGEDSSAIGIDGDQADNSKINAGAVYVFARNADTWSQEAYLKTLKASSASGSGGFGEAVSTSSDGSFLLVGTSAHYDGEPTRGLPEDPLAARQTGAAFAFVRGGGVWSQRAYIRASNPEAFDMFAHAVAVSADGGTLAIGATGEDSSAQGIGGVQMDDSRPSSGAVYVY